MFACPRRTKEHEAIVSVNCLSSELHSLLLAIGAEPGSPVKWHEQYETATGPAVNIDVIWKTDDGIKTVRAQEMVTNIRTEKTMQADWVFGGSQVFVDEESGVKILLRRLRRNGLSIQFLNGNLGRTSTK